MHVTGAGVGVEFHIGLSMTILLSINPLVQLFQIKSMVKCMTNVCTLSWDSSLNFILSCHFGTFTESIDGLTSGSFQVLLDSASKIHPV